MFIDDGFPPVGTSSADPPAIIRFDGSTAAATLAPAGNASFAAAEAGVPRIGVRAPGAAFRAFPRKPLL